MTLERNLVGPRVRYFRSKANPPLTQEDLAGRLAALDVRVDRSAIARIEQGERYVLDYELRALAIALRVPVEHLFADAPVAKTASHRNGQLAGKRKE